MTTFQRDGSNETGCACHWTEAGIRAEVARETREQVACLLYTSPSPRDLSTSRMPSSA